MYDLPREGPHDWSLGNTIDIELFLDLYDLSCEGPTYQHFQGWMMFICNNKGKVELNTGTLIIRKKHKLSSTCTFYLKMTQILPIIAGFSSNCCSEFVGTFKLNCSVGSIWFSIQLSIKGRVALSPFSGLSHVSVFNMHRDIDSFFKISAV